MTRLLFRAALLAVVLFTSTALFSQSSNGTISGTIADASGAVIPSVSITATNNATGVVVNGGQVLVGGVENGSAVVRSYQIGASGGATSGVIAAMVSASIFATSRSLRLLTGSLLDLSVAAAVARLRHPN